MFGQSKVFFHTNSTLRTDVAFNEMIDKHHHNGLLSSIAEVVIGMISQFNLLTTYI